MRIMIVKMIKMKLFKLNLIS